MVGLMEKGALLTASRGCRALHPTRPAPGTLCESLSPPKHLHKSFLPQLRHSQAEGDSAREIPEPTPPLGRLC
jgi:hypothetical protein